MKAFPEDAIQYHIPPLPLPPPSKKTILLLTVYWQYHKATAVDKLFGFIKLSKLLTTEFCEFTLILNMLESAVKNALMDRLNLWTKFMQTVLEKPYRCGNRTLQQVTSSSFEVKETICSQRIPSLVWYLDGKLIGNGKAMEIKKHKYVFTKTFNMTACGRNLSYVITSFDGYTATYYATLSFNCKLVYDTHDFLSNSRCCDTTFCQLTMPLYIPAIIKSN